MIDDVLVVGCVLFVATFFLLEMDGPFDLFVHIRTWIANSSNRFLYDLFGCFWCLATWISAILTITYSLITHQDIFSAILMWLASIAVAGFINRNVH